TSHDDQLSGQRPGTDSPSGDVGRLVGMSPAMQIVFKQIALVADSDLAVLITGETGTGKELVAAAIHQNSSRRDQAYLPLAPVALSPDLIESELFGHVAGAFTGATSDRPGLFEKADGGTILLDEIGDLPLGVQLKLLRVLDSGQYLRVGDVEPKTCNVRILAATNRDLQACVREGAFREDLYYRLNGLRIELPPLRTRQDDIELLARYFLQRLGRDAARDWTPSLSEAMRERRWRGNVRELRNAMEHAAVLARGRPINAADLPEEQQPLEYADSQSGDASLKDAIHAWCRSALERDGAVKGLQQAFLEETQMELIEFALQATNGNRSKAAEMLGIHRGTLREKLREKPHDADESDSNEHGD
ncbi:MAG: sigma-54 dependent transcriptional regulator, partial [Planctomycetota bacterium]